MKLVTREDFKVPEKCMKCKFVLHYHTGSFVSNPHWCCELVWFLRQEDWQVDPEVIDEYCPLKCLNE